MDKDKTYDVLVIGAGPGGYVAAIRASQLGLSAAVIEKDKPGGVCLNVGCIPSKALIHQAETFAAAKGLSDMGITVDLEGFDYKKVFDKSRKAATKLSRGISHLLKKNKIDYIEAEATRVAPGEVELSDGSILKAKNVLIATGSRPREIPEFPIDEETILSSTGALFLEKLPESLLILGAGAIGVEFAHILNRFGVEIHLVEMLDQLLPIEDKETVDVLTKSFKKRGIKIYTSTKALSQEKVDAKHRVTLEAADGKKEEIEVEKILVSVGRLPNTESLELEKAGVEIDQGGFITVGDYLETKVDGIYAIGDVIRTPLLAHVASSEGEIAVEHMAGRTPKKQVDLSAIPSVTYCEPQVASFGYTEQRLKEESIAYKKISFPFVGIGKAVATEKSDGMVKILLAEETEEILGAHIVGAEATELIHELLLAKSSELLPADVIHMMHAHPTLSEGIVEAMRGAMEGPIHM